MESRENSELRYYWQFALRWWWFLLLFLGVATGATYVVSKSIAPTFQATTTLIVGESLQSAKTNESDVLASIRLAKTYAEVVGGPSILQATIDSLGLPLTLPALQKSVLIELVRDTQLIRINVFDRSPDGAQRIANEIARQLIVRSPVYQAAVEQAPQREFVQRQMQDLRTKLSDAQARLVQMERTAAGDRESGEAITATQADTLRAQIYSWQDDYGALLGLSEPAASSLSIVEPARVRTVPVRPRTSQNVLLAAVVSLLAASGIALFIEHLDDSIKSLEEVGSRLNVTPLGAVAPLKGSEYADRLITNLKAPDSIAESYGMIHHGIDFACVDKARTIAVTSPSWLEGKSETAANLAVVVARSGKRVILVDADLRRPVQHRIFRLSNDAGLTSALSSSDSVLPDALDECGVEGLRLMPGGPSVSNPSGLLASERMHNIIDTLQRQAEVVIVDCPPVLAVADAPLLANRLDATLLVIDSGRTSIRAARRAVEQLRQAGVNRIGAVMNGQNQAELDGAAIDPTRLRRIGRFPHLRL